MAVFSANRGAFTPSLSTVNYTLWAAGVVSVAFLTTITWGGRANSSTAYRTRWAHPSTPGSTGASANLTAVVHSPGTTVTNTVANLTFNAVQPVLPTEPENLFAQDWNAHGGVGLLILPVGWIVCGTNNDSKSQICCINTQGTDANVSEYGLTWEE